MIYIIEYAKSRCSSCRNCKKKIAKNELRIALMVQSPFHDGKIPHWYHPTCFFENHCPKNTGDIGDFGNIRWDDQKYVKELLEEAGGEAAGPAPNEDSEKQLKEQNESIFYFRDQLQNLRKQPLVDLLMKNKQTPPKGMASILDLLSDGMAFGASKPCPECNGQLMFVSGLGYQCSGDLNEWTKCDYVTLDPKRTKFVVSSELKKSDPFFKNYRAEIKKRLMAIPDPQITTVASEAMPEDSASQPVTICVKSGGAVDPDSGLSGEAHIYRDAENTYSVTLGKTSVQSGKNSFYEMQILESDRRKAFWFFRSWRRIGTANAGTKLESLPLEDCITNFVKHYANKSGNEWNRRENFRKVPDKLYPIDIDYVDDAGTKTLLESELKKPVQDLIKLIFNINQR